MKYRKTKHPKRRLTVYLADDLYRRLAARARAEDRTLSALIAEVIRAMWRAR